MNRFLHLLILAFQRFSIFRTEIIRPHRVSDAELIAAMAVDAGHPMFLAFLELIDRARAEARMKAMNVIVNDRETVFALGEESGLNKLEEYLFVLRAEGNRQLAAQAETENYEKLNS